MRRLGAGVAIAALLYGQIAAAQELPGFPPGVFQNTAAMGGVACSPSSLSLNFTTGSLPGGSSLTRASNGTYINISGVLSTATTNAARFNYDANYPSGNAAPSLTGPFLLYEPAATNLALQSNAFTTTWFTGQSAVVTAAQFTSPDGTNDGWSVTSGTGFGGILQNISFSNVAYTASVWAYSFIGTPPLVISFGTISSGNLTTAAAIKRYAFSGTATAGSSIIQDEVNTGAGSALGLFGSQLETGSAATSYIPTTTGSAPRAADAFTGPAIPSCAGHFTVTFDDNSTQSVTAAWPLTTTLNRPNIKSIVGAL